MTSKYVTESRAGHVTFPSVSYRAMGHSILSLLYTLGDRVIGKSFSMGSVLY